MKIVVDIQSKPFPDTLMERTLIPDLRYLKQSESNQLIKY